MNGRIFSVILLPTSDCNVACDYCFEHKEPHRLSLTLLPLLTRRLLGHLEHEGIKESKYIGRAARLIMGPAWFVAAGAIMDRAAAERDRRFLHYLQTNLISYSEAWNPIIATMFKGSLGTSMDTQIGTASVQGGAEAYTRLWTQSRGAGCGN
jgi:sulfatase maturation enzyme AslB (radical SAM superfamily)